jgi:hypothetical protein
MQVRYVLPVVAVLLNSGPVVPNASQSPGTPATSLNAPPPQVHNRALTTLMQNDRTVVRLDERQGDGVAWWPDVLIADGTIELMIRGKDVMQRSFVGVAFHGLDEKTYDAVYFRPFNFRVDDPARRSRAVQYIAHPAYTWNKLREERPGVFEHGVLPAPDPTGWFHARIVVKSPQVRVFVNDSEQPSLEVTQLSSRKSGWVGLWVGNGSGGDFAAVKVVPSR